MANVLRQLPSVDRLLQLPAVQSLVAEQGHDATVDAIRAVLGETRHDILNGATPPTSESLIEAIQDRFRKKRLADLQPVVNAAGVIIHTNLGRAPLSQATRAGTVRVARGIRTV